MRQTRLGQGEWNANVSNALKRALVLSPGSSFRDAMQSVATLRTTFDVRKLRISAHLGDPSMGTVMFMLSLFGQRWVGVFLSDLTIVLLTFPKLRRRIYHFFWSNLSYSIPIRFFSPFCCRISKKRLLLSRFRRCLVDWKPKCTLVSLEVTNIHDNV